MSKKAKKGKVKKERSKKPLISACMMVKNEEELLPRCLGSIKDVVDEIIVVDTGSSDRTIEIAESYGAKVYHHLWENDFSRHRNQSISYATGDWIFVIDADEVLFSFDRDFIWIPQDGNIDSIYVKVENIFAQGKCTAWHNSIRLFRKNGRISYKGRVHNELRGCSNSAYSPIVLQHSGYALNQAREDEKFRRTKGLLEAEIQRKPEDPRNHHYLAVSLVGTHFYAEALEEAETALRLASNKPNESLYLWTRFVAAVCCINLGRVEEAEAFCREAINLNPWHLDSYFILSSISYSGGMLQLFLENSNYYLSLLARARNTPSYFKDMVLNTVEHEWRMYLHRGFAFERLGISGKACKEYELALEVCSDRSEYSRLLSEFRLTRPESDSASDLGKKDCVVFSEASGLYPAEMQSDIRLEKKQRIKTGEVRRDGSRNKIKRGISLCMIVKNEEELLPKCLESAKNYVDEIIIVDTGSSDRSVEIAECFGAKVFHHPWEGDFSRHRNQSIGYCTREWILILDADEVVESKSARFLRDVLKEQKADSIYLSVRSAFDKGKGEAVHNSIRLFRNNGAIRYEGRVHNQLVGEQSSVMYPVTVLHEGYNLPAQKNYQKFLRTTELLKKEIEEKPDQPRGYHYLAASYLSESRYHEALDYARKAIRLAEEHGHSDHLYLWSYFIAGISSLKLGRLREAEEFCTQALVKNPLHLDSHYLLTIIYCHIQQWENVLHHGREYIGLVKKYGENPGEFGLIVHNTHNHRWRVHAHMGLAMEGLQNAEGAEKEFSMADRLCSEKGEYHKLLAGHYLSRSSLNLSETHFKKASESLSADVELLKIGVEIYGRQGETEKEKELLKKIIELDAATEETSFRLGTILLQENSLAEASRFFQNVIAANPRHTGALINMGLVAKRDKRFDEAVFFFKMALREDPCSVEGLSNLGYTLYDKGDMIGAEETLGRLSGIAPELADPLLLLSRIHVEQGHFDRAVEDCDAILRLLKLDRSVILQSLADLADLYLKIGETLLHNGQMAMAYGAFKTALLLAKNAPHMFQRILALYPEGGNFNGASASKEERVDFSFPGPENTISGDGNLPGGLEQTR